MAPIRSTVAITNKGDSPAWKIIVVTGRETNPVYFFARKAYTNWQK
jgi:hypothetical protein